MQTLLWIQVKVILMGPAHSKKEEGSGITPMHTLFYWSAINAHTRLCFLTYSLRVAVTLTPCGCQHSTPGVHIVVVHAYALR